MVIDLHHWIDGIYAGTLRVPRQLSETSQHYSLVGVEEHRGKAADLHQVCHVTRLALREKHQQTVPSTVMKSHVDVYMRHLISSSSPRSCNAAVLVRYARISVHFPAARPPPGAVTNSLASLDFHQVRYNHSARHYCPPLSAWRWTFCTGSLAWRLRKKYINRLSPAFSFSFSLTISHLRTPGLALWFKEGNTTLQQGQTPCLSTGLRGSMEDNEGSTKGMGVMSLASSTDTTTKKRKKRAQKGRPTGAKLSLIQHHDTNSWIVS